MPQIQIQINTISSPDLVRTFADYTRAVTQFYQAVTGGLQNVSQSIQSAQQTVAALKEASRGLGGVGETIGSAVTAISKGAETITNMRSGWTALRESIHGVVEVLPKVHGFNIVEYFTSGAAKMAGFRQSIDSISQAFRPFLGTLGVVGAAVAGWQIGRYLATAFQIGGKTIDEWVEIMWLRVFGWFNKVPVYLESFWELTKISFRTGWDLVLTVVREKIIELAKLWNRIPKMPKIDTGDLEKSLADAKNQLVEDVMAADRIKAGRDAKLKEIDQFTEQTVASANGASSESERPQAENGAPREPMVTAVQAVTALGDLTADVEATCQALQDSLQKLNPGLSFSLGGSGTQGDSNSTTAAASPTPGEKKKREYDLTWGDQLDRIKDGAQDKWGAWSKQMADTFSSVFEKGISSISNGITGLIEGTKTWGQALQSISSTILNTVISAFVEMGVRYVMTKLLMSAIDSTVAKKTQAENLTTLGTALPTGLAQSGAQGGWVGLAAFIALFVGGLAALTALTSNARASGGPVLSGLPYIVGEKRPELFVPSQSGFIMPSVPAIMELSRPGAASTTPSQSMNVHFAGVLDSEDLAIKGLSGKRGKKFLLDFNKGSVREVTGRG